MKCFQITSFKTEYVIKTRYINLCDATINANKRYTAQVFEKIRMNNREEEIHGYVYVPQNQKIVKVSMKISFVIWLNNKSIIWFIKFSGST